METVAVKMTKHKHNKDKKKKKEETVTTPRKNHWVLKSLFFLLIILLIFGISGFFVLGHIEEVRENSYNLGANEAVKEIKNTVDENGGVIIEYNGASVTLGRYHKPISEEKEDNTNSTTTNSTE